MAKRYSDVVQRMSLAESEIAAPFDLQYVTLSAVTRDIMTGVSLTGTTSRRWSEVQSDWGNYGRKILRVDNNHDQPITIFFNRQDAGDFTNLDGTPISVTIPANRTNVLIGPEQLPFLGWALVEPIVLGVSAAVAPTSGWFIIAGHFSPLFG